VEGWQRYRGPGASGTPPTYHIGAANDRADV
jgi:hypothetical protein